MANELQNKLDAILEDKNTNLLPENLKAGVTCLGIEGVMQAGIDTSDATAIANDIRQGSTAYVNGELIEGTLGVNGSSNYMPTMFSDIQMGTADGQDTLQFTTSRGGSGIDVIVTGGSTITGNLAQSDVANAIGLTADKIKFGETILGIIGAYTGEESIAPVDWAVELTNFGISDVVALSTTTPNVKTRITFTDDEGLGDTTTLPELEEHIMDIVLAKITSGANWNYCAYITFDNNLDTTLIKSNIALSTTGIGCSGPAYPEDVKTSTSGYKYIYTFHSPDTDAGYETFKTLIEDGTTAFKISLTMML